MKKPYAGSAFLLSILIGIFMGLGLWTFNYANGFSYLSNDPKVCINCHVMQEQYDGWQKSSHHAVAVCNDCHAPHNLIRKYLTKAENGFRHSLAFTLQNFHEPIRIRPKNAKILNEACLNCHGSMTEHILLQNQKPEEEMNQCTRCHRSVGHGVK